jgi:predicted AAA+ superfamily ATPase
MYRNIEKELIEWKDQVGRKPLLVRGARQIGKSYTVEKFGRENFAHCVTVNLEIHRECLASFKTLEPKKIIASLAVLLQQEIIPGETLLFIDEIQESTDAIMALRYFKEQMPELHVIAAGSLLEFVLNKENFRMPVGRVESLYMYPCSFEEFLIANKDQSALKYLGSVSIKEGIDEGVHLNLLGKLRDYFIVGGMPEILAHYVNHHDYLRVQTMQGSLRDAYRHDFGKYAGRGVKIDYLLKMYETIPNMVGKHFKYVSIDPDVQARDLKPSLKALEDAGLIHVVYHTSASGLPLHSVMNERRKKLLFVDIGLLKNASDLGVNEMLNQDLILLNQGALAEQFVGQELCIRNKKYEKAQLYYWEREKKPSISEVDYIVHHNSNIFPVEVKSGTTGRLKSLQRFVEEKHSQFGIRISEKSLSFHRGVLSVPMYMMHQLDRLIEDMLAELG